MKKIAFFIISFLVPAYMAFGAGYQLNLQGLRQLAMGGGGTAMPWDASTIFYNPGGLSMLDGIQVYGSGQLIMPRVAFAPTLGGGGGTVSSVNQTFPTFNFYAGGPVAFHKKLGFGVGVYTPFGSGLKWDDNWTGRYISQEIYLQSIFIQPTLSYRINDMVSVGGGFVYAFGNVRIRQAIPIQDQSGADGAATLKGNANGTGYNLGINIKATDKIHFGISYRSQVNMKVKNGDATFVTPQTVASSFPNTTFTSSLPLPQTLSIGVSVKPIKKLTIQLDFNLTGWKAYDTLSFLYAAHTAELTDTHAPRNYQNRLATRLGAHYQATHKLAIMIGGAYDPSPVADGFVSPDLPDANRIVLSCGLTYKIVKHLTVLAALEYVTSAKRHGTYDPANFSGTYQTKALTPGIGLSYDFK